MIAKFKAEHAIKMREASGETGLLRTFTDQDFMCYEKNSIAISILEGENVIACAGALPLHKYRATIWAFFSEFKDPRQFVPAFRIGKKFLDELEFYRLEAWVDPRRKPAMRMVKLLGFEMEQAYVPYYFSNGVGASAWARMK